MSSNSQFSTVGVRIDAGEDTDMEELDRLTRQLLLEVRELDVESAELLSAGEAPMGSKSADALTAGALVVAILPSVVSKLLEYLCGWVRRREGTRVRLTVQEAGRSLEVEFTSDKMPSQSEFQILIDTLTSVLSQKGSQ